MLQQIIRDMYVDPDILTELPEEQKEMLFFKIREEQIRRYNERETQLSSKPRSPNMSKPNKNNNNNATRNAGKAKKVRILEDEQGKPWTWVYGECEGEITAEEKWKHMNEKRTKDAVKAVIQQEEKILKSQIERQLNDNESESRTKNVLGVKQITMKNPTSANGDAPPKLSPVIPRRSRTSTAESPALRRKEANKDKEGSLAEKIRPSPENTGKPVPAPRKAASGRPAMAPKPLISPANSHVLEKLHQGEVSRKIKGSLRKDKTTKSLESTKVSYQPERSPEHENDENIYESFNPEPQNDNGIVSNEEWQKQLRQFREADERRSIRARRASNEYRRQSLLAANPEKLRARFSKLKTNTIPEGVRPPVPQKPNTLRVKHPVARPGKATKPQTRDDVKIWFAETQAYLLRDIDRCPGWLHGIITRSEAEELLKNKQIGDFLVRVSDKIWGYALSYKDTDRIKHFLIDASEANCYHFFGNDQIRHESLDELIAYHHEETITYNGEVLKQWVGQSDSSKPDYAELNIVSDTRL